MGIVQGDREVLGRFGAPERLEVWDCLDCGCAWFVGAQERQWLMRLAVLLSLVRYLDEASDDTGSLQRYCEAVASIEVSVTQFEAAQV